MIRRLIVRFWDWVFGAEDRAPPVEERPTESAATPEAHATPPPITDVVGVGPVNAAQLCGGATGCMNLVGAEHHQITCTGDGSPSCGDRAPASMAGLSQLNLKGAVLAWYSWSAGAHYLWRALLAPDIRDATALVVVLDGTYTTHLTKEGKPDAKTGNLAAWVEFAKEPGKVVVFTASAGKNPSTREKGKVWPSAAEGLDAIAARLTEELGGGEEGSGDVVASGLVPAPERAMQWGGRLWLLWYPRHTHQEHATTLGRHVWKWAVQRRP